ncbi:unknown protein [Synechococcus elongatus PCC 6301]|uniref:Peptidase M15A C-terminal domain-containing protein n=1 Tax=Synechococcus sp. (strain ATCC 27144 / PCC 6301 / SAUG 1402/1) TaxID=269084 RepID=A0A0H3K117_SYNP6|nr:D-Ala-D-Ala carboxypeptidase family metallohydrolase [Synechococcus elongatus]BAD78968.1 unknown protein [Synechococcus elongatus PCC 6301]
MSTITADKFLDFFIHFDPNNPNHRRAAYMLAGVIPDAAMRDSAEWVKTYRTANAQPLTAETVQWSEWDARVSEHFTVGEVFQFDDFRRQRVTAENKRRIVKLAARLDVLRKQFGPLGVTSWFRDPVTNARVGGVDDSYHLTGGAADVSPLQFNPLEFEQWCEQNWNGGVGRGIKAGRRFVHLDDGPKGVWDY